MHAQFIPDENELLGAFSYCNDQYYLRVPFRSKEIDRLHLCSLFPLRLM